MKGKYLCGTAAIALLAGLGVGMSPANAFDKVHWKWDKDKFENVWVNKWTWGWFHPDGETQVQELQLFVGNVQSKVKLNGDYTPVQISGGTATVLIDEDVDVAIDYDDEDPTTTDETANNPIENVDFNGANPGTAGQLTLTHEPNTGNVDEVTEGATFSFNISGEFEVEVDPETISDLDANTHLGHALQTAAAIGAVSTIESSVPIYAHEGQYVIGDIVPFCESECASDSGLPTLVASMGQIGGENSNFSQSGNRFHDVAAILVLGRALGLIEKSHISAEAEAGTRSFFHKDPVEIAIQQDVTAVAGQLGLTLASDTAPSLIDSQGDAESGLPFSGDTVNMTPSSTNSHDPSPWLATFRPKDTNLILEADITQVGFADVEAKASAYQDLRSYTNLGSYTGLDPERPGLVARQNATAAGLIKNISVSINTPEPPATP